MKRLTLGALCLMLVFGIACISHAKNTRLPALVSFTAGECTEAVLFDETNILSVPWDYVADAGGQTKFGGDAIYSVSGSGSIGEVDTVFTDKIVEIGLMRFDPDAELAGKFMYTCNGESTGFDDTLPEGSCIASLENVQLAITNALIAEYGGVESDYAFGGVLVGVFVKGMNPSIDVEIPKNKRQNYELVNVCDIPVPLPE